MKKIISLIILVAVLLTMVTLPAAAAVNGSISGGYTVSENYAGLYGKAADEYAAKFTTTTGDTKSVMTVSSSEYDFSDSKYIVLDLNFAPLDDAEYISVGANAGLYAITTSAGYYKNQWNSVRVVLEEKTKEEMKAEGTYQPLTLYVNGSFVDTKAYALNSSDEITGNGTATYGKAFRFSVHGPTATDVAYVADARLSESNVNEAPVLPELVATEKYSVEKYGIALNGDVTIADLDAGENTIRVYNGGNLVTDTAFVLTEDCVISVCDEVNNTYKNYMLGEPAAVNEWTDDDGNTYTWSYSPLSACLTIGMVESPTVAADTKYGAIDTESWAGGASARPWYAYRGEIESIAFETTGKNQFLSLGREMFAGFTALREVTIPRYVCDSQWGLFNICTSLETVTFEEGSTGLVGGYTGSIKGMKMFAGCSNLKTVNLSSGTTALNAGQMFYNCTSLEEIYLPPHISGMANDMFNGCGDITLSTYANSTTAALVASKNYTGVSSVNKIYFDTKGTIADKQGNEGSISWEIDSDAKTLVISDVAEIGTGDLPDKAGDNYQGRFPWNAISGYNKIIVEDGITRLGRWFLQGLRAGAQESISIPGTITSGSVFSFVGVTATDLIFHEGATGIFSVSQAINRDCKINNVYLPSTAKDIVTKFWRALDGSDSEEYLGYTDLSFYAPLGSDAYKWASYRSSNAKEGMTINALANITVDSFADENVVVSNNAFAEETADIIVAYFDGEELMDAAYFPVTVLAADTAAIIAAPKSAAGYTREVFVWNNTSALKPLAISGIE